MQEAFTIQHRYTQVKSLVIPIAIVVSIALLYVGLCELTPILSKTPVLTATFGKTLRLANMLRALVLVSPAGVIGTGVGALLFSISNGSISFGAQSIVPVMITMFGLVINRLYTTPTMVKDLSLLAVYGMFSGLMVSMNNTLMLLSVGKLDGLISSAITGRVIISMFTVMAGYPLVLAWRKLTPKD
jgi:hypothetical protein